MEHNMTFYTPSTDDALASGGTSLETGCHSGVITEALWIESEKKTKGVELTFRADNGAEYRYLNLYFMKASGEMLQIGNGVLSSITLLIGASGLNSTTLPNLNRRGEKQSNIKRWGEKQYRIPELFNKRIGLVLQKSFRDNGKYSFNIKSAFDPDTRQTYKERSEGLPAERVKWYEENLLDDIRNVPVIAGSPKPNSANTQGEFDDDIPF